MSFKFHFEKVKPGGGFMITNSVTGSQVTILARGFGVDMIDNAKAKAGIDWGVSKFFFPAQYRELQKQVIGLLLDWPYEKRSYGKDWKPKEEHLPKFWLDKKSEKPMPRKLRKWWHNKAVYCIRKRFATHWAELMEKYADPKRRALSRALCSAFGPRSMQGFGQDFLESVYGSKYWINDLIRFPAACYALQTIAGRQIVAGDVNWMELYSDTGSTYRSLNKTLMAMPRRMHEGVVGDIRVHHLNEPWYGRAKILFMLEHQFNEDIDNRHLTVFRRSTNDEIVRVARMARRRHLHFKMNRLTNIIEFKNWLNDYPDPYAGDLRGLFMRSYRWHQEIVADGPFPARATPCNTYKDEYELVQPPWGDLPVDGLTFLDTAGALRKERTKMKHCVDTYVSKAARGRSFLYHYQKGEEKATIELNQRGRVVQAYGPCNQKNSACDNAKYEISEALVSMKWKNSEDSSISLRMGDDEIPF